MSNRASHSNTVSEPQQLTKGASFNSCVDFWRNLLAGELPVLDLPLDRRRGLNQPSGPCGEISLSLPSNLAKRFKRLAEQENASLSSLYLTAYAILLSRYGSTPDVLIGISARAANTRSLAGDFADMTLIRAQVTPEATFRQLLRRVSEFTAEAQQHQHVPVGRLLKFLDVTRPAGRAPLCDACFLWESGEPGGKIRAFRSNRVLEPVSLHLPAAPFDVALRVQSAQDSVKPSFLYREDLFKPSTIERMSRHWLRPIEDIVSRPDSTVSRLEMMPEEERALVLGRYAGVSGEYPRKCLHELFANHAAARPDAEALVFGTERLTYRQLDERSNQIAHFLRNQGVALEDRIGIFMDRSAGMIV